MSDPNDFSPITVALLGKRAGQKCSQCKRTTSGGNENPEKATVIGEAAHIRGAKPKSARFDAKMTSGERSHPSNGIWLCNNCHTEIDRDEKKFTFDILLKIKREHEDSVLNIEPVNPDLNFNSVNNAQITGNNNYTIVNNIYIGTVSPNYPDQVVEQVRNMKMKSPEDINDTDLSVTISPFMGVVKSPELPGTRVQLEFTILNSDNNPKVVKGAYLRMNKGQVHFKKFFRINNDSSREPDYAKRFPIVINSKGVERLAIEFENLAIPLIKLGRLEGEIVILTGDDRVTSKSFIYEVNEAMMNTLDLLQQQSIEKNIPIVFDAMIKS